jgi:hypothetical protein
LTLSLLLNIATPPNRHDGGHWYAAPTSLGTTQRTTAILPARQEWGQPGEYPQEEVAGIAERYPAMKQDDQQRMQDRMREWAGLSPLERSKVRDTYKDFKQLPAEQNKWSSKNGRPIRTCRPKNASASASQASHRSCCHPQALLRTHRALKRPLVSHRHRRRSTRVSSADEQ